MPFVRLFDFACLVLSVSSTSWCLGRAAACDCSTPWTFLLPFLDWNITAVWSNDNQIEQKCSPLQKDRLQEKYYANQVVIQFLLMILLLFSLHDGKSSLRLNDVAPSICFRTLTQDYCCALGFIMHVCS